MIAEISKLIRARRQSLHMTIEQLAEKSKSSVSLISLIERGKLDNIKIKKLDEIAKALDLDLANFFISQKLQSTMTLDLINYLADLPEEKREEVAGLLLKVIHL